MLNNIQRMKKIAYDWLIKMTSSSIIYCHTFIYQRLIQLKSCLCTTLQPQHDCTHRLWYPTAACSAQACPVKKTHNVSKARKNRPNCTLQENQPYRIGRSSQLQLPRVSHALTHEPTRKQTTRSRSAIDQPPTSTQGYCASPGPFALESCAHRITRNSTRCMTLEQAT